MNITYDILVSACQAAAEDDSSEFQAYLPFAINLAEERLLNDFDSYGLVVYVSVVVTAGTFIVSKPSGIRIIKSLTYINDDGSQLDLLQRTDEFLRDYWPIPSSVGIPKYYANYGISNIYVAPTPVSTTGFQFSTVERPNALSVSNQTNFFSEYASDALFHATMVEMMIFDKNPSMQKQFEERYKDRITALQNEARRTRRDDQTPAISPAGADNTLTGGP